VSLFRRTPIASARWVAIDCETSGLDASRDRLLSVGAIALAEGRIALGERFAALVRQPEPSSAANIIVHGIGGDAQRGGRPADEVVRALGVRVGDAIPVGFHAVFDATILRRHGFAPRERWIDLAALLPALFADRKRERTSLDHWLQAFGIPAEARHDALGDALAAAQLMLVALAEAKRQRLDAVEDLRALERDRRWL
jgi:DNA polymerase III subunit epsilon